MIRSGLLALTLLALAGCSRAPDDLSILVSSEEPAESIARTMVPILREIGYDATVSSAATASEILEAVSAGRADLAVIEEPDQLFGSLTTITPLYPSVLHVLYRADMQVATFAEVLRGHNVYAGPPGGAARRLLGELSLDFGVSPGEYQLQDDPWSVDPDVYFIFGGLLPDGSLERLAAFRLFSFGDPYELGSGTTAEGISLRYPNVRTFILPENLYGPLTPGPVLTLATRSVLLAAPDLPTETAFELAEQLVTHAQSLAIDYPLVSQELTADFDPGTLVQPLHPGARRYLDRDKPSFIERYVEVMALGITLLAGLFSGVLALVRVARQRRKDRVDVYYRKILDIRAEIENDMGCEALDAIATRIRAVQEEVFELLVDERISADDTLTIFLDLSNQVLAELASRRAQAD